MVTEPKGGGRVGVHEWSRVAQEDLLPARVEAAPIDVSLNSTLMLTEAAVTVTFTWRIKSGERVCERGVRWRHMGGERHDKGDDNRVT